MLKTCCTLQVGRWDNGYVICVKGRGRIVESLAIRDLATRILQHPARRLIIDLNDCDYLDSTNLGSLLALNGVGRREHSSDASRLTLAATDEKRRRLFGATKLDKFFRFIDQRPPVEGGFDEIPIEHKDQRCYGLHALEAHELLGNHPCAEAPAFRRVAQQLERELAQL